MYTDANGDVIVKVGRLDVNSHRGDALRNGERLNLETTINGRPIRVSGNHTPTNPAAVRSGNYP